MTRDQQRAKRAFELVAAVAAGDRPKYQSLALSLPVLVRTAGLVQAAHFVANGAPGEKALVAHLASQLRDGGYLAAPTVDALLARARQAELPEYMALTREALAVLQWHKRMVQGKVWEQAGPTGGNHA